MAESGDSKEGDGSVGGAPVLGGLTTEMILGQSKSKAEEFVEFKDLETSDKNTLTLVCPFCKCTILRPGYGSLEKQSKFLPSMTEKYQIGTDPAGDTIETCWKIADKFHFENMGFSRNVNGEEKYLICADCERGPFGWTPPPTHQESFIAVERVQYART